MYELNEKNSDGRCSMLSNSEQQSATTILGIEIPGVLFTPFDHQLGAGSTFCYN